MSTLCQRSGQITLWWIWLLDTGPPGAFCSPTHPLLGAFTGARLKKLGQLRATDVRCRDGIDYLSVNTDDEGKSLKTRSSHREIPIHPELVRCGFLTHVEQRRSAGDEFDVPRPEAGRSRHADGQLQQVVGASRPPPGCNGPPQGFP